MDLEDDNNSFSDIHNQNKITTNTKQLLETAEIGVLNILHYTDEVVVSIFDKNGKKMI